MKKRPQQRESDLGTGHEWDRRCQDKHEEHTHDDAMDQWLVHRTHFRNGDVTQKIAGHPPDGEDHGIDSDDPPERPGTL